jgi:hypothetical protein
VVKVGVADEDSCHLAGRVDEAIERRRVGQCRSAPQEVAEGDPREIGVDEQRLSLEADPVAGDAEPFDLQPGRQLQLLRLELAEHLAVFVGGLLPRQACLGQLTEMMQRSRHRRYAVSKVVVSAGELASVWKTTQ